MLLESSATLERITTYYPKCRMWIIWLSLIYVKAKTNVKVKQLNGGNTWMMTKENMLLQVTKKKHVAKKKVNSASSFFFVK